MEDEDLKISCKYKSLLKVYFAGPCKNVENEGREWREKVTLRLQQNAEWTGTSVKVFNPLDYFSYTDKTGKTDHQVMSYYMHNIKNSDVVLVNLDNTEVSGGTCMEVQYAADHDIPIIGFGTENIYPWILCHLEVQFANATEALDYIRDYYMR